MANFGLLEAGYVPKTLAVVREELQDAIRSTFGASIDVGDRSIIGQIIGILAEAIALVWETSEAVNSSQDPDKATGAALDAIAALTGTFREPASYSTVALLLSGDASTVVTAATQVRTASTEQVFATVENTTLVVADDWVTLTNYAVGDVVKKGGNVYYCFIAGTTGATGPTHTGRPEDYDEPDVVGNQDASDGTVVWVWLSEGDAYAVVDASATVTGPIEAAGGDISVIVSGVNGLNGVFNPADAEEGRDQATDEELRIQRDLELSGAGTSPPDAIAADLLRLEGVTAVRVFMNNTDTTDADGMPPHSVEALVQGGEDQDIINQMFASVAAGIATTGNTTGSATDSQGTAWTVKFSRPDEVAIYVDVTLTYDADEYEGDTAVKDAIADLGDGQVVGLNAVASRISAAVFSVPGVLDVTAVLLSDAPGPVGSATIPISLRQLATYDTLNVAVTSTPGTP